MRRPQGRLVWNIDWPTRGQPLWSAKEPAGGQQRLDKSVDDWSMARNIEATETGDEAERQAIMDEIVAYNREDLEATWAVLQWLAPF